MTEKKNSEFYKIYKVASAKWQVTTCQTWWRYSFRKLFSCSIWRNFPESDASSFAPAPDLTFWGWNMFMVFSCWVGVRCLRHPIKNQNQLLGTINSVLRLEKNRRPCKTTCEYLVWFLLSMLRSSKSFAAFFATSHCRSSSSKPRDNLPQAMGNQNHWKTLVNWLDDPVNFDSATPS